MFVDQCGDPRRDGRIVASIQNETPVSAARGNDGNGTLSPQPLHHCTTDEPGPSDDEHNTSCQLQVHANTLAAHPIHHHDARTGRR
jgi:hypothetical protein